MWYILSMEQALCLHLNPGLEKLRSTKDAVDNLAEEGRRMATQVEIKVTQANAFARQVEADKAAVNAETQLADVEAAACAVKARDVADLQGRCEQELAVAEPLVAQAEAALNTLSKKDLGTMRALRANMFGRSFGVCVCAFTCAQMGCLFLSLSCCCTTSVSGEHDTPGEMKSLKKPPAGVDDVTAVVLILLEGNPKDKSWAAATRCMNNVDKFLERLKGFKPRIDAGEIPPKSFEAVRTYLELPHFNRYAMHRRAPT